jgi:hypothetical protein
MSVVLLSMIILPQANSQKLSDEAIKAQIEKARQKVAVDQYGCVKYPAGDEIVVCGPNTENERQKLPRSGPDKDRIRTGEAVSTTRAATRDVSGCGVVGIDVGCTILPKNTVGIGKPPPPMPPDYAGVIQGLPEPEDIVTDGEAQNVSPP